MEVNICQHQSFMSEISNGNQKCDRQKDYRINIQWDEKELPGKWVSDPNKLNSIKITN